MRALSYAKAKGIAAGFHKFALSPPTQVDDFIANVENGKDAPPDPSTLTSMMAPGRIGENPDSALMPQDPSAALGAPTGRMPPDPNAAMGFPGGEDPRGAPV
jgi:hypothetical protein